MTREPALMHPTGLTNLRGMIPQFTKHAIVCLICSDWAKSLFDHEYGSVYA